MVVRELANGADSLASMAGQVRNAAAVNPSPLGPRLAAGLQRIADAAISIHLIADQVRSLGFDANDRAASAILGDAALTGVADEALAVLAAFNDGWRPDDVLEPNRDFPQ